MGVTLTLFISSGSRLLIEFIRFIMFSLWCSETGKKGMFVVALPAIDMVFAHRPGDIVVAAWTLFGGL